MLSQQIMLGLKTKLFTNLPSPLQKPSFHKLGTIQPQGLNSLKACADE